jgi:hypothetical protein
VTTFQKSFVATAGPLVLLSLISTGGAYNENLYVVWFLAAFAWLVALVAVIVTAIAKQDDISSGILAGFGVGFLALFVSCFANIGTIDAP